MYFSFILELLGVFSNNKWKKNIFLLDYLPEGS